MAHYSDVIYLLQPLKLLLCLDELFPGGSGLGKDLEGQPRVRSVQCANGATTHLV